MPIIQMTCFAVDLCLIRTIVPNPAFTNNPDNNAPNDKFPDMNNLERSKLEAQLGIRPMTDANTGDKYLLN